LKNVYGDAGAATEAAERGSAEWLTSAEESQPRLQDMRGIV
jgi:hypothetical protein